MYNYLYQYEHGKAEDFASVRLCISGGASMPVALLQTFEQTFDVTILEGTDFLKRLRLLVLIRLIGEKARLDRDEYFTCRK